MNIFCVVLVCRVTNSTEIPEYRTLQTRKFARSGEPCVFPFKYKEKTFYGCTWYFSHITANKAWCSTKVDKNGNADVRNQDGTKNLGICDEDSKCTIPPKCKFLSFYICNNSSYNIYIIIKYTVRVLESILFCF